MEPEKRKFKRNDAMKRDHRSKIFHWRSMGVGYEKICQQLGISRGTAVRDYKLARTEFDEKWKCDAVEKRNKFLRVILSVAREAWDNYLAIKNQVMANPASAKKVRLDYNLSLVLKAVRDARDLLGVDVPKQLIFSGNLAQERTQFVQMMDGIQGSVEGPRIDLGVVDAKGADADTDAAGNNGKSNGEGK